MIPVIRQKALGAATPLPRQITQTLLEWTQSGPSADPVAISALGDIYRQWRTRGSDLLESPFDYALLEIARNQPDLPRRLRTELKSGFAAGEDAIRSLLQAWVNTDWETLPKACRQVLAWDPDRWGVLALSEAISDFRTWLDNLTTGPMDQRESSRFITDLLEKRPPLEKLLGSPPWLQALLKLLVDIQAGHPLAEYQAGIQTWCPWLAGFENVHDTEIKPVAPDAESVQKVLSHFSQHLKNWSDLDTGLESVKDIAPAAYPMCRQLANGFQTVFHLNADLDEVRADGAAIDQPALAEACDVLQALISWREAIREQYFEKALAACAPETHSGWRILEHAHTITQDWRDTIQPCLNAIEAAEDTPCAATQPELGTVLSSLADLTTLWAQVYTATPHQDLLESLEAESETLQRVFHTWRHGLDHDPDQATRLLYHSALIQIRSISDKLLQLAQHTRQARLSFTNLESADALPYARQIQAGDSLLDHLGAIEALLVQDETARKFPAWHNLFQQITSLHAISEQREAILEMDKSHPLYAWLIQSTLARDT